MTLTKEALEAVEKAATSDINEDISKAAKGRLVSLVRASAAVRTDIAVAEMKSKTQLALADLAKK